MKLLSYLLKTKKDKYLLGRWSGDNHLSHYADGTFAVHSNGKSQGGLVVEYGGSVVNADSGKHICTKDSIESEGVTVSNYVPRMEWFVNFLTGKGEFISSTTLLQDNKSTIMIIEDPTRGKLRTRHMKARFGISNQYFIVNGGTNIKHLKTDLMVADILTKPLAYPGFRHFASRMLNHISWEEMSRRIMPDANDDEIHEAMGS